MKTLERRHFYPYIIGELQNIYEVGKAVGTKKMDVKDTHSLSSEIQELMKEVASGIMLMVGWELDGKDRLWMDHQVEEGAGCSCGKLADNPEYVKGKLKKVSDVNKLLKTEKTTI